MVNAPLEAGPIIDLNPDNQRSDVRSPHTENWPIGAAQEFRQSFGDIEVTLRAVGGDQPRVQFGWWKAGYDTGATFCSDGVTTSAGSSLEIHLSGLSAGKHSIALWHNDWERTPAGGVVVEIPGQPALPAVQPTARVLHDDDAATSWCELSANADGTAVVRLRAVDSAGRIVLNGLAIDVPDPARQARRPTPQHGDQHAPEQPRLTWLAPRNVTDGVRYQVYLGEDRESVANAAPGSQEEICTISTTVFATDLIVFRRDYYWRIDVVEPGGEIVPGPVWSFRIRRLAFPGAEGYGRYAIGGRGGRVIPVTNLNDSGPGSLRAAVEAEGPRTVVFRVGGTIPLRSKLVIRSPYLTVAGQTAPGDGICIRGYTFGCLGTHDVILRHLRIRVGDESGVTMDGTGLASTTHSIIDHCSISWSIDEAVSSRGAGNVTVQHCLIAEALNVAGHQKYEAGKGHSFAGSISGNIGSFHHNLLVHCAGRNWSLAGGYDRGNHFAGRLDIRNNVVFNWEHRTNDGGVKALNLVNNLYLPGPASRVFHLLKPDAGSPEDPQQYFVAGNRMEGRPEYDADNWLNGGVVVDPRHLATIRLTEPFGESGVETQAADEILEPMLATVGATLPRRDSVDARVIHDVRERTATARGSRTGLPGIIDSQADVGGWPALSAGEPWPDTDLDGLPDAYELTVGLNPLEADQNTVLPGELDTALEVYLAELCRR
jgi:hypothetical protein